MSQKITVADLVAAVSESARSEAEFVATVVHLVNSGAVRLEGRLQGARIELPAPRATVARLRG
jgi:hypothetical protein